MEARTINIFGTDGVQRQTTVKAEADPLVWGTMWRLSRTEARRVVARPMRCGYQYLVTIDKVWYWVCRYRQPTRDWSRMEWHYYLIPNSASDLATSLTL